MQSMNSKVFEWAISQFLITWLIPVKKENRILVWKSIEMYKDLYKSKKSAKNKGNSSFLHWSTQSELGVSSH